MFRYVFVFFLAYFLLVAAYYLFCAIIAFWEVRKRGAQQVFEDFDAISGSPFTLPVSVIIPAHNEEDWILNSTRSALGSDYPEFEVIVVDDGSTDGTFEILRKEFDLVEYYAGASEAAGAIPSGAIKKVYFSNKEPKLRVVSKESGQKKAGAVNAALKFARYPYFCELDADTVLEPDGILKVMAHVVKDPEHIVGAGSYFGLVNGMRIEGGRIIERSFSLNPLLAYQNLEYLRSFIGTRTVWSKYNATPIISGGFAIWRRDFITAIGGFAPEHSSEDIEITFRAQETIRKDRSSGYQLLMLPYFVGWTEGPATLTSLLKQRNRWQRCVLEALWEYKHMIANPRYGGFGLFTLPYFLLYEALGVFFEVASIILTVSGFFAGAIDLRLLVVFFVFISLYQSLISLFSLMAFVRDQRPFKLRFILYLVLLGFVEFFWYRWLLVAAKFGGTADFLRGVRNFDQYERDLRNKRENPGKGAGGDD